MLKFGLTLLAMLLAIFPSFVLAQDAPTTPPPISGPTVDNPNEDKQPTIIIDSGGNLKSINTSTNPASTQVNPLSQPGQPVQRVQTGTGAELYQPSEQPGQKNLPNLPPGQQVPSPGQMSPSQQPQTIAPPPDATSTGPMGR